MNERHPIQSIMSTTMENIKDMVDVNTVVGDPVQAGDGTTIIPISRVSFGFLSGGGEYGNGGGGTNNDVRYKYNGDASSSISVGSASSSDANCACMPFAGGTGAGVSVHPMGFLVVGNGNIKMLPTNYATPIDRVMELLPQVIGELKDVFQDDDSANANHQKSVGTMNHAKIPIETTKPIYDNASGIYGSKMDPVADYSHAYDSSFKNHTKPESFVYTAAQSSASAANAKPAVANSSVNNSIYESKASADKLGSKFDTQFGNKGEKKWTNATVGDDSANK